MVVNVDPEYLRSAVRLDIPLSEEGMPTRSIPSKLIIVEEVTPLYVRDATSVTLGLGRLVNRRRWRREDQAVEVENVGKNKYAYAPLDHFAELSPKVEEGDHILAFSSWDSVPQTGIVHGNSKYPRIRVDGTDQWFTASSYWVKLGPPRPEPEVAPEDKALSDWWLQRIIKAAKDAKKANRWCGETDRVVKELLRPALENKGFKVETQGIVVDDQEIFDVLTYDGRFVARFTDDREAQAYAKKKTDELFVF